MPTIEEICDSILSGNAISNIDEKQLNKVANEKGDCKVPEHEKIARILDELSKEDEELEEKDSSEKEEVPNNIKVASPLLNDKMEKMAVAATILDTLNEISENGSAERCFREYFQERA